MFSGLSGGRPGGLAGLRGVISNGGRGSAGAWVGSGGSPVTPRAGPPDKSVTGQHPGTGLFPGRDGAPWEDRSGSFLSWRNRGFVLQFAFSLPRDPRGGVLVSLPQERESGRALGAV